MKGPNNIPEFGIKRDNEERRDGGCGVVFDPQTQKYALGLQEGGRFRLFSGGVEKDEDIQEGILREIMEESGLHDFLYVEKVAEAWAHYCNTLRKVNRVAKSTCFLVVLKSTDTLPVQLEDHEKFSLTWATAEEIINNWQRRNQNKDNDHWIYFFKKSVARIKELGYDKSLTSSC